MCSFYKNSLVKVGMPVLAAVAATKFVNEMAKFPEGSEERRLADSVLQVSMSANYEVFENLKKEDPIMCDALRELMKPELEEAADKGADKKAKDIAERMIRSEKLNDHDIAYYTGLTVKQVQELKNKASNLKQELSQVVA